VLRIDRGDDGDDDRDHRSGRRSGDLRAVLRELRPGRDPLGRDAALRHAHEPTCADAGLVVRPDELAAAFNDKTKAIIINTPNNPTGKVFTRDELETIAALCRKWDAIAISDEIYEHIIYDGRQHVPIATIEGWPIARSRSTAVEDLQRDRLARRLDDLAAVADRAIRKVHDFLTVGAPAPLQEAGASRSACPTTTTRSSPPATRRGATSSSTSSSATASSATSRSARTTS
jgi:hypothetical protein